MPDASKIQDKVSVTAQTRYVTTMGLEVHAQLLTQSKMYCGCDANIAYAPPNSHVCPVCHGYAGHPAR